MVGALTTTGAYLFWLFCFEESGFGAGGSVGFVRASASTFASTGAGEGAGTVAGAGAGAGAGALAGRWMQGAGTVDAVVPRLRG